MANVKPFSGILYDQQKVGGDLKSVTTPPYDQINSNEAAAYHDKHPHSYIRLILAKQTPQDSDAENRYTRARDTLSQWLGEGVLHRDEGEAYYVYRQHFSVLGKSYTRTGLMAAVHHDPPENGVILRHERTLPKHVDDRLNLLRATRTQFESIFLLYDDPQHATRQIIEQATRTAPLIDVTDDVGTRHEIWRVSDASSVEALNKFFADRVLLIADGHHRYQTTGLYHQETGQEENAWVLATLYAVDDPGIVILPTHRVVKNIQNFNATELRQKLAEDFEVTSWTGDVDSLMEHLRSQPADQHVFAYYEPGNGLTVLKLRDEKRLEQYVTAERSLDWMKLDVSILHRLILDKLLGITQEAVAREGNLEYRRWPQDAIDTVKSGQAQAVFFLNATRPTQVRDLATKGELMPQKSTDFYPKLLSGLVAMPLPNLHAAVR
jgi:uncharacterized protein (DUF1015 family)